MSVTQDPCGPEAVRVRVRSSIAGSGLAQREFARRISLDETKLSKALSGTRRFSPAELVLIADVAGVALAWLISGADPQPASIAGAVAPAAAAAPPAFLRHTSARTLEEQLVALEQIDSPVQRLRKLLLLRLPDPGAGEQEWSLRIQGWAGAVAHAAVSATTASAVPRARADEYERWVASVLTALREGQEAGVIIRRPPERLALLLTSLLDGLGVKVLAGMLSGEEMRAALEEQIDLLLADPG